MDNSMSSEIELADAFVLVSHPASEGWHQIHSPKLETLSMELEVDMVLYKKGQPPIAVVHMATAYVSRSDLEVAYLLRTIMTNLLNGRDARVLLVYRDLLVRPQKVPHGISIMTIIEGRTEMAGLN
jgi:hypothetical protein